MFGGTERFPPTGVWAKTAYRYPLEEVMVSTNEVDQAISLHIYPNPAAETLTLELADLTSKAYQLRIQNLQGQVVYQQQLEHPQLSLGFLPSGTYTVQLLADGVLQATSKLIKH